MLGPRLEECARTLLELNGPSALELLGPVDALKLRSSLTLFARAAPDSPLFRDVLDRYYGRVADEATDDLLEDQSGGGGAP